MSFSEDELRCHFHYYLMTRIGNRVFDLNIPSTRAEGPLGYDARYDLAINGVLPYRFIGNRHVLLPISSLLIQFKSPYYVDARRSSPCCRGFWQRVIGGFRPREAYRVARFYFGAASQRQLRTLLRISNRLNGTAVYIANNREDRNHYLFNNNINLYKVWYADPRMANHGHFTLRHDEPGVHGHSKWETFDQIEIEDIKTHELRKIKTNKEYMGSLKNFERSVEKVLSGIKYELRVRRGQKSGPQKLSEKKSQDILWEIKEAEEKVEDLVKLLETDVFSRGSDEPTKYRKSKTSRESRRLLASVLDHLSVSYRELGINWYPAWSSE